MPSNYVRTTDRGNYCPKRMEEAVVKVRSGTYSGYEAAIRYNVPRTTLMDRVNGRHGHKSDSMGRPKAIPHHIEEKLAEILNFMQLQGFHSSQMELSELIGDYLIKNRIEVDAFRTGKPGVHWTKSFLERHDLESRANKKTAEHMLHYFCVLKKTIEDFDLSKKPGKIWNINETCFAIGKDSCVSKFTTDTDRNATVLTACSAAGNKVPILVVLKENKRISDDEICHASTSTGKLDRVVFNRYFTETFLEYISAPTLIIYSGNASNIDIHLIEDAREADIVFLKSPLYQEDVTGALKAKWKRYIRAVTNENEFVAVIDRGYKEFEEDDVQSGFRNVGIHPFDSGVCGVDFARLCERYRDNNTVYEEEGVENSEISRDVANNAIPEFVEIKKEVDNDVLQPPGKERCLLEEVDDALEFVLLKKEVDDETLQSLGKERCLLEEVHDENDETSRVPSNDAALEFVLLKKEVDDETLQSLGKERCILEEVDDENGKTSRDASNDAALEFVLLKKEVDDETLQALGKERCLLEEEDVENGEINRDTTDAVPAVMKKDVDDERQPPGINDDWKLLKDDDMLSRTESSNDIGGSFYSGSCDNVPATSSTATDVSKQPKTEPASAPSTSAASAPSTSGHESAPSTSENDKCILRKSLQHPKQSTEKPFGPWPSYGGIIDAARTVRTPSEVCCVFGCRNNELEHLDKDFYPFPEDQKLLTRWLELINRLDLADRKKGRDGRVCSAHFDEGDHFNGALKVDAVPHLELPRKRVAFIYAPDPKASGFLPSTSEVKTEPVDPDVTEVEIQFEPEQVPKIRFNEPTIVNRTPDVPTIKDFPPSNGVRTMVVEPIPQSNPQNPPFKVIKVEHTDSPMEVEFKRPRRPFLANASMSAIEQINIPPDTSGVATNTVQVQTTKALLDQMNLPMKRKYEGEIREANKKIKRLEHQLTNPQMNTKQFLQCCDLYLDEKISNIVKSHAYLLHKCVGKGNRYSIPFKIFALNLYLCSPQSYRFVEQFFNLPSIATIRRFQMPIRTGINQSLIDNFKVKVGKMNDKEKICALCFDYIGVKKNLYYDISNDYLCGIHDIDHVLGSDPAQYATLLMVRGLYSKWKQPISFALVAQKICYPTLKDWVLKITAMLIDMGLNVKAFVTNMDTEFLDLSDVSASEPYFEVNERKIYHVFDVPYLFKNARDDLLKYNFHFGSKVAKWSHILKVYDTDKEEELSLMPKITKNHVRPKGEAKDNPKIAVDVFSHAVAAVMSFHVKTNLAPKKSKDTVEFITKMGRLYDVLTSQRTSSPNQFKQAYKATPEQEQFLTETLEYLQMLEMKDKDGNPVEQRINFVTGLIVTIKSIMALLEDLKKEDVTHILTKNLSKDCMDSYFARVCQIGGNHVARPTSIMFARSFRRLFLMNLVSDTKEGVTDLDLKQTLIQISEYVKADVDKEEPEQGVEKLSVGVTDYQALSCWPMPSLKFLSGYLLWKCLERHNCKTLLENLGKHYNLELPTDGEGVNVLIDKFKEYNGSNINKKGLIEPPQDLVGFVEKMDEMYHEYYRRADMEALSFGWNFYEIMKKDTFDMPCPCFPLKYLKFLFIRTKIYHTVKEFNQQNRTKRRRR